MSDIERISAGLESLSALAQSTAARAPELAPIIAAMRHCLAHDGTLFFAGNGGSAADAQHLATEYVVRYQRGNQRPLRAIALTTDTSTLTAASNDFGFDQLFVRQLQALGRCGDVLLLHSTSGRSANCVEAAKAARVLGILVIAFTGRGGGELSAHADHTFAVDDHRTNHVQELHLAVQHQIAAILTSEHGG